MNVGNFEFIQTEIKDVIVVEPKAFGDERGLFMETYQRQNFVEGGIDAEFVQDNQSTSAKGVLRGMHYQVKRPQAKLVRVIQGSVFDVAVDIRRDSPSFGKWVGVELSAQNHRQLFIPRGLAHGFLVLSDTACFAYKCDDYYLPQDEGGIAWNDALVNIQWPLSPGMQPILSKKDATWVPLDI